MKLIPPANVARVAAAALQMRGEQPPSRQGGTAVGIARAKQLSNRHEVSPSVIKRMVSFFARHSVDKNAEGFRKGEPGFPSKGRQAWDLWGGDPGHAWAKRMLRSLDAEQGVTEMTDVRVLRGSDVRRSDGLRGKIVRASLPWVTVEWADGVEQSFLRSDAALAEDIEVKTLNAGWCALADIIGVNEAIVDREATDDEGQDDPETDDEEGEEDMSEVLEVTEEELFQDEDGNVFVEDASGERYYLEGYGKDDDEDEEEEEEVCEYCDGEGCEECEEEYEESAASDADEEASELAEAIAELRNLRSQNSRLTEAKERIRALLSEKKGAEEDDSDEPDAEFAKKIKHKPGKLKNSPYRNLPKTTPRGKKPEKVTKYKSAAGASQPGSENFFGNGPEQMPRKNRWACEKKGKYKQVCKDLENEGRYKVVRINKAYKAQYNKAYRAAELAGATNSQKGINNYVAHGQKVLSAKALTKLLKKKKAGGKSEKTPAKKKKAQAGKKAKSLASKL